MLQQANRPGGNIFKARSHDSSKHKLYGFSTEASVLFSGICINLPVFPNDGESDIVVFRRQIDKHKQDLGKFEDDGDVTGTGKDQKTHWAVLAEK